MHLKLYKLVKNYTDVTAIAFCLAENEEEALRIMEWYPAEDHGATVKEYTKRGCFTTYTLHNAEIKVKEELVKKADAALGGFVSRGGLLNEEQVKRFRYVYYEDPVVSPEEEE
jgi:hypothetical protein